MVLAVCFIEGWVISRSHCFGRKEMEFGQKHYLSQMDSAKRDSSSCENAIMYLSKRENWRSKRNSLCCVKSFHHLKLVRIQWSGEGPPQWEEQILLLSLPSKNSPGVSRTPSWVSCFSTMMMMMNICSLLGGDTVVVGMWSRQRIFDWGRREKLLCNGSTSAGCRMVPLQMSLEAFIALGWGGEGGTTEAELRSLEEGAVC